jgi:hypothetical protein
MEWAHETIMIDPLEAEDIDYSRVFSSVEYISIPTDSNFLIGEIDKMYVSDNHVILMDKYLSKSVFIFEKQTKEKVHLHKQGNGPGEYVSLSDFYYDAVQRAVAIHCGIRRKLLFYNLQGILIKEQPVRYFTTRIIPLADKYVLFSDYLWNRETERNKICPNIILMENTGKILSSANFFKRNLDRAVVWSSIPDFSQWEEKLVSIKPDHSNIIYHVTADSIFPAYKLDFGTYTLDNRYWKETEKTGATLEKVNDYSKDIGLCETLRMLEDKDYLFFKYKFKGKVNSFFYSKKTGEKMNIRVFLMIWIRLPLFIHSFFITKNCTVSCLSMISLLQGNF